MSSFYVKHDFVRQSDFWSYLNKERTEGVCWLQSSTPLPSWSGQLCHLFLTEIRKTMIHLLSVETMSTKLTAGLDQTRQLASCLQGKLLRKSECSWMHLRKSKFRTAKTKILLTMCHNGILIFFINIFFERVLEQTWNSATIYLLVTVQKHVHSCCAVEIPVNAWKCPLLWLPGQSCLACCGHTQPPLWSPHHKGGAQVGGHAPIEQMTIYCNKNWI